MARIQPVNRENAHPEVASILDAVQKKMGMVPNLISTMANSAAVANAYLGFSQSLSAGALPARLREQIALVVGETNSCDYCLAAHTLMGKGAGLSEQETCDARQAVAADDKEQAAINFARLLVKNRGQITDDELQQVRAAGYSDGEVAEIVANVSLNIFTNYFNHVADTDVDFPAAPELAAACGTNHC